MNKGSNLPPETLRRGGATVGYMVDIEEEEFLFISYFRSYCDGYESRIKLQDVFISNLGVEEGYATLDALDSFCELIYKKGRRQLIRHDVSCECIGADENCLCQLVFSACEENIDDAKLIGTLITDAYLAEEITMLARKIGMSIRGYVKSRKPAKNIANSWITEFSQVN